MEENKRKAKGRKPFLLVCLCLILIFAGIAAYWFLTADDRLYNYAIEQMQAENFPEAIAILENLPDHRSAPEELSKARYQYAMMLMEDKDYLAAIESLQALGDYRDSARQMQICYYNLGTVARLADDYAHAEDYYRLAGDYRDARLQTQRMLYAQGHKAFLEEDYAAADGFFAQLEGKQEDYGYPHFQTLREAVAYLDAQRKNLNNIISFHIDIEDSEDFYTALHGIFPCQYSAPSYYKDDKLVTIARIQYYPGDRILHAWRNDDTSGLTEDELQVMELALEVVAQGQEETDSPAELERWLHDWICRQVTYQSPNMQVRYEEFVQLRELNCIGAMLDATANCQGYADTFYLLGTLAGFDVGKVSGTAGGGHIWNTIMLDGQRYIVDVTFDDISENGLNGWYYTFYNTFMSPDEYTPYAENEIQPAVLTTKDLSQTYFYQEGLIFSDLDAAVKSMVSQRFQEGKQWTYALVENSTVTSAALRTAILRHAGYRNFSCYPMIISYGEDAYIVIYWN